MSSNIRWAPEEAARDVFAVFLTAKELAALRTIGPEWAVTTVPMATLNVLMMRSLILYRWSDPVQARCTDAAAAMLEAA